MPRLIKKGSTDITTYVFIADSADGSPETGITITDLDLQYVRLGAAPSAKVDATALAATDSAHGDNQAIEIDATDQPGLYRVDWPDAAFVAGVDGVVLTVKGTGFHPSHMEIQLNEIPADVIMISGDTPAADNLELQYDGTGIIGDTFPSFQSQLASIANVGSAVHTPADSYTLTTGTQSSGTVSSTAALDGTNHEHTDVAGEMKLYYEFLIGSGIPTQVVLTGYLNGNNDNLEVNGWDWVASAWVQIGTLNGKNATSNEVNAFDMFINMVGSGANEGIVRVELTDGAFTLTTATLAIDQIFMAFASGVEGYDKGSIWIDTTVTNTGTVVGRDGTSRNPVSTMGAANTLSASTNLNRFEVAPGSAITFAASQDNQVFNGENWTLALGGQSISGSHIIGADVSGIATGASAPTFTRCHFGTATLPPSHLEFCTLEGTITAGSAGDFFIDWCVSGIPGIATPIFDFGSALNASQVNFRNYSGGIEIQYMGAGTGTYNMSLEGRGALVINANCSATSNVRIRGPFELANSATGVSVTMRGDNYDGGAVWVDTNITNENTVGYVDGTADNPVSTLVAARAIADDLNIKKLHLVSGSSVTLAQNYDDFIFDACHCTIALGGQSINNAVFIGAVITGSDDGSNASHTQFFDCVMTTNTLGQFVMTRCYFLATITLAETGSYFMHQCFSGIAGLGTPVLDFGVGLGVSDVSMRDYSGGIHIHNMGNVGADNLTFESRGQMILNANCNPANAPTIAVRGVIDPLTDNVVGGFVDGGGIISQGARISQDQILDAVTDDNVKIDASQLNTHSAITTALIATAVLNETIDGTLDLTEALEVILALAVAKQVDVAGNIYTFKDQAGVTKVTITYGAASTTAVIAP